MIRYAACVEYRGCAYSGWQKQHHAHSVQSAVENAVSRVADGNIDVVASGRTDTGVHATGQVIHFDSPVSRKDHEWLRGINTYLPADIRIIWVTQAGDDFHARFKALDRSYRYVILNRHVAPACLSGLVTWHRQALDIGQMKAAAQAFLGEHDFSAFRAAGCQNRNPVKRVTNLALGREGDWLWMDITANGFLHHMVRNIIGVLLQVGEGRQHRIWASEVLASLDRTRGGITAPADGLYFVAASYSPAYQLPAMPPACRFW